VVGDPKSLHDLYRVDAQVKASCGSCGATEVWELGALIDEVRANGGNTDWRSARYAVKCPHGCASPMVALVPIPFGKQRARSQALRRVRHSILIKLALDVLHDAAVRSTLEVGGDDTVRLALHVLRPFVDDDRLLATFWEAATTVERHPWTSCHLPYRAIVRRLTDRDVPLMDVKRL
jgi:hypothetical protein